MQPNFYLSRWTTLYSRLLMAAEGNPEEREGKEWEGRGQRARASSPFKMLGRSMPRFHVMENS